MAFRPLRLRRTLDPIVGTGPLFTMYTPQHQAYESTITSITITRGTSGRNTGHHPTTCEAGLTGSLSGLQGGQTMRVFLRETQATALAALLGTTYESITSRFSGRVGAVALDDDGQRFDTTVSASSWLTQMNYSPKSFTPTAGQTVGSLLADMTDSSEPLRGIDFGTALGSVNITHYPAGDQTLYKDGIGTFCADIGIMMQERRDGKTYATSHVMREFWANSRVDTEYPLMRGQAIAPGNYEQPNERPAKRVDYTIVNSSGGTATRTAEIANPTGELREIEAVDWTIWQTSDVDNQLYREAYARVFDSSARLYRIPTVKVDLLMLLRLGTPYALRIARQMLLLEVGEPVFFSGDWPSYLRGAHFADGIKETITPTSWEFELSLLPQEVATGTDSPIVPARAWDSATAQWDEATTTWNEGITA